MKYINTQVILFKEDPSEEEALIITAEDGVHFSLTTVAGQPPVFTLEELDEVVSRCRAMVA